MGLYSMTRMNCRFVFRRDAKSSRALASSRNGPRGVSRGPTWPVAVYHTVDQVVTDSRQTVHSADTGEYERQSLSSTSPHEIPDFPFHPLLLSSPSSLAP